MSQTTQPRTVIQDLKLIRKAIRRITLHPDKDTAKKAVDQLRKELTPNPLYK